MTLLLKYIEKIKIHWLSTALTIIVQLNDLVCMLGFFIVPFIKYPESIRIGILIAWMYASIIFFVVMVATYKRDLKSNDKEIAEYKKDKVVYTVNRIGVFIYFAAMFCLIFLARNDYMNISLFSMIGIAVLGLLLFAIIIALLTQYKNNYVKMAKDTITFLFAFFVVILFSMLMFAGVLAHGNENFPKYFSEFLVGISAIPLLLGGIYLVCKMFLSSKMLNEKSDALPISIVLFIAIGIVTCILLRYTVTDDKMQQIMATIFSAILGGAITLAGVAWTIKDANNKRQEDLERIEKERKEEERKKHIPYIKTTIDTIADYNLNVFIREGLDLENSSHRCKLNNNVFYAAQINDFTIKNVSTANIIIKGIVIDEKVFWLKNDMLLEPNLTCKIITTGNYEILLADNIRYFGIIINDIFENTYKVNCSFKNNIDVNVGHLVVTTNDGVELTGFKYNYLIQSAELPTFVSGEKENE